MSNLNTLVKSDKFTLHFKTFKKDQLEEIINLVKKFQLHHPEEKILYTSATEAMSLAGKIQELLGEGYSAKIFNELELNGKGLHYYIEKHFNLVFKINQEGEKEYLKELPEGLDPNGKVLMTTMGTGTNFYITSKGADS